MRELKFKVGDKVKIVNNNNLYIAYEGFVENNKNENTKPFKKFKDYYNDKQGVINYIGKHEDYDYTLAIVNTEKNSFIIDIKGLELVEKCNDKFKVGDKVKRIKGEHRMAGMKTGDIGNVSSYNKEKNTFTLKEYGDYIHYANRFIKVRDIEVEDKTNESNYIYSSKKEKEIKNKIKELEKELELMNKEVIIYDCLKSHTVDVLEYYKYSSKNDLSLSKQEYRMIVKRKGNKITCEIYNKEMSILCGVGVSICHEDDEFDETLGLHLAKYRAMQDWYKRSEVTFMASNNMK